MRTRPHGKLLLLAAVLFLLASCTTADNEPDESTQAAEPDAQPTSTVRNSPATDPAGSTSGAERPAASSPVRNAAPPDDVPEALDFSAPRLGGGRVSGADFVGTQVALWFWAPW